VRRSCRLRPKARAQEESPHLPVAGLLRPQARTKISSKHEASCGCRVGWAALSLHPPGGGPLWLTVSRRLPRCWQRFGLVAASTALDAGLRQPGRGGHALVPPPAMRRTNHPDRVVGKARAASCTSAGRRKCRRQRWRHHLQVRSGPCDHKNDCNGQGRETPATVSSWTAAGGHLSGAGKRQILYMNTCARDNIGPLRIATTRNGLS